MGGTWTCELVTFQKHNQIRLRLCVVSAVMHTFEGCDVNMTCKDCIHVDMCYQIEHFGHDIEEDANCKHFKGKTGWISVKDRLPEKEGKYMVYKESECFKSTSTAWFSLDLHEFDEYDFPNKHRPGWNNYDSECGYYEECGVTHWMPLPEPPEN